MLQKSFASELIQQLEVAGCDPAVLSHYRIPKIDAGMPLQSKCSEFEAPEQRVDDGWVLLDAMHLTEQHQATLKEGGSQRGLCSWFEIRRDLR